MKANIVHVSILFMFPIIAHRKQRVGKYIIETYDGEKIGAQEKLPKSAAILFEVKNMR